MRTEAALLARMGSCARTWTWKTPQRRTERRCTTRGARTFTPADRIRTSHYTLANRALFFVERVPRRESQRFRARAPTCASREYWLVRRRACRSRVPTCMPMCMPMCMPNTYRRARRRAARCRAARCRAARCRAARCRAARCRAQNASALYARRPAERRSVNTRGNGHDVTLGKRASSFVELMPRSKTLQFRAMPSPLQRRNVSSRFGASGPERGAT